MTIQATQQLHVDVQLPRRVDGGTGLQLAAVFADHMVLQRHKQIHIFGWDQPGTLVQARLTAQAASATDAKTQTGNADLTGNRLIASSGQISDPDGNFDLLLPALPAGGPYTLTVNDGHTTQTRTDVWIGEVWVAAGQSNMEFRLRDAHGGQEAIANSTNPAIRFFQVPEIGWFDPNYADREQHEEWKLSQPDNAGDFSAVAWFFARDLQKKLGIHVGILSCYVGGSSASSWISLKTLANTRFGQRYIDDYEALIAHLTPQKYEADYNTWKSAFDTYNDNCGKARKENPDISMEELTKQFGECPWPPPAGPHSKYRPAGTFESMVLRVARYSARGVMWYQGSGDENRSEDYHDLLTLLVAQWRALWRDPDQQWLVVQLPRFIDKKDADAGKVPRNWADLRKAQWDLQRLSNVHTVVILDQGEFNNLHPLDKEPVGQRLALAARQFVHGDASAHGAPMIADSATIGSDNADLLRVTVHFPHPVVLKDPAECGATSDNTGFELVTDEGICLPATATVSSDKRALILTANAGADRASIGDTSRGATVCRVRYGWRNWTAAPLFDTYGLPVAPFELWVRE